MMTLSQSLAQASLRPPQSSGDFRIVAFDNHQTAPSGLLAELHSRILPTSPLVRLGHRFMEKFYYEVLPENGLIFGAVAYLGEQPAAFVVATDDSSGFIRRAIRRCWLKMTYECCVSLLTNPRVLKGVPEALALTKARFTEWRHRSRHSQPEIEATISDSNGGEILSIGTLPEFQTPKFHRDTRLNLAEELLKFAVNRLQNNGTPVVRCIVDADNKPAQFFYHSRGWRRQAASNAGWKVPVVEFVLRPQ